MGMPNGKSEAWYIISAKPDAQIGVGLTHRATPQELRASIRNGSIVELVQWRPVAKGDVIFIPAGTIHALGAGIVLAEIQQRSDTTYRLFDYGRQRELHVDDGVAVANSWPLRPQAKPARLTPNARFSSRAGISFSSEWTCRRVQAGHCLRNPRPGFSFSTAMRRSDWPAASVGQALFMGGGRTSIEVGANGLTALIAYPAALPIDSLLQSSPSHRPIQFSQPLPTLRNPPNWPRRGRDAAAQDRADRQFIAAPLRHRDVHDGPATRDRDFSAVAADRHRGDDRPRQDL